MSKFMAWIDERLPVSNFVKNHLSQYYAPKNFWEIHQVERT